MVLGYGRYPHSVVTSVDLREQVSKTRILKPAILKNKIFKVYFPLKIRCPGGLQYLISLTAGFRYRNRAGRFPNSRSQFAESRPQNPGF